MASSNEIIEMNSNLDASALVLSDAETATETLAQIEVYKVYRIRWLMLIIFVLYSASNSMQWVQYSIIANVIVEYYGVSFRTVDWTSMIYMVLYIPFTLFGSYVLDRLGLKVAVMIGMSGTCAGALLKVASVAQDRFWIGFLGQSIVALSQVFVLSTPPRLAAVWFGPKQVSYACSIGVLGNQVGVALGLLLPPMIVKGKGEKWNIERELYTMFILVGILTSVIWLLVFVFFKSAPSTPPSQAQLQMQANEGDSTNFIQSIKRLFTHPAYMLLLIAYGINAGIFYSISTLLNQIILTYYKDALQHVGLIGLFMVLAGMVSSLICGVILDKFHRFKETTLVLYICSLIVMIVFTFTLDKGITVVYIVTALLGFFMIGLLPVGLEFAIELTYPEPEGTSAALLNAACQIFGIIFTWLYSLLLNESINMLADAVMSAMLLIGTILIVCIRSDLKRQTALKEK